MRIIFLFFLLLLSGVLMFQQNDYSLVFERLDLVRCNKDYVTAKIVTFKYNRTQPALNATFVLAVELGNDVEVIAQAYTFASNEYRLFPLHLGFNLCDAVSKNYFGLGDIHNFGNFSNCPIKKETYCIRNWAPDSSRFPPYIPNGQYMLELQVMHSSAEVVLIRGYGTVSRPLGRRH